MYAKLLVLCPTLCDPMDLSPPGSSVHGILQARILTGVGCCFLLQGIFPTQGSYPHVLHLLHWQAGSLPPGPPGDGLVAKSCLTLVISWTVACQALLCPWDSPGKNTGVGCRALLQGIFLTQGSNPGLLHCRQVLYHLSHQGKTMCLLVFI